MSKEKKVQAAVSEAPIEVAPTPAAPPAPVLSAGPARLADVDRLSLDLARTKRQTALAEAKTALANNENAELTYKYLVLQLYMKYGLTHEDAISESGDIILGGAKNPPPQRPQGQ